MTSFKLAFHAYNGRRVVEVFEGDEFIAGVYPGDSREFKIVTKHAITIFPQDGEPNSCVVKIGDTVP